LKENVICGKLRSEDVEGFIETLIKLL